MIVPDSRPSFSFRLKFNWDLRGRARSWKFRLQVMWECSNHVNIEFGSWGSRLIWPDITTPACAILMELHLIGHLTWTFSSYKKTTEV
jgi:hypothetical protein